MPHLLHSSRIRRTALIATAMVATAFCAFMPAIASADDYPSHAINLVVPYPPGGSTDVIARVLGQYLSTALHQPVVVENRGGAAGRIGTATVARAQPDGYTLLATNMGPAALAAAVYTSLPYQPTTDFAPISTTATMPLVLAVPTTSPFHSAKDLIAAAKAAPKSLNCGTTGSGGLGELANAQFMSAAGISSTIIPYKGGPEITQAALGGQIAYFFLVPSDVMALVHAGKLRALAVMQKARSPLVPEVPTIVESGGPDVEINYWNGLLAPAKTPPQIVHRLNDLVREALRSPQVLAQLQSIAAVPAFNTPEQFSAEIASDVAQWSRIAKVMGVHAE